MLVDREKLVGALAQMEEASRHHAFGAKMHVAIKLYAQASILSKLIDLTIDGEFDVITEEDTIN